MSGNAPLSVQVLSFCGHAASSSLTLADYERAAVKSQVNMFELQDHNPMIHLYKLLHIHIHIHLNILLVYYMQCILPMH